MSFFKISNVTGSATLKRSWVRQTIRSSFLSMFKKFGIPNQLLVRGHSRRITSSHSLVFIRSLSFRLLRLQEFIKIILLIESHLVIFCTFSYIWVDWFVKHSNCRPEIFNITNLITIVWSFDVFLSGPFPAWFSIFLIVKTKTLRI